MDQDPIKKIQSTNPIDIRAAIDIASGGDDNAEVDINKFEDALIGQTTLAARVGFKRAKAFFKGMVGQESAGGKDLTSVDGARGAYQVMPDTAKKYKMDVNDPYQNRFMGISYWDEGFRKAIEANNANIGTDTVSLAVGGAGFGCCELDISVLALAAVCRYGGRSGRLGGVAAPGVVEGVEGCVDVGGEDGGVGEDGAGFAHGSHSTDHVQ